MTTRDQPPTTPDPDSGAVEPKAEAATERAGASDTFEALAAAFYRDTGMLPLGKDDPLGYHTREERRQGFDAWLSERAGATCPHCGGAL